MGKKEETPLQATVKQDDALKKTVEKFIKTGDSHLKKKNADPSEAKQLYTSCITQREELDTQIDKINSLQVGDEPSMKEGKFATKKNDELKKLNTTKEKLKTLEVKLKPEDMDVGSVNELSEVEDSEEESEEDEESEDEEESGEEEEEEEENSKAKVPTPKKRATKTEKQELRSKQREEEEEIEEDIEDEEEEGEEEDEDSLFSEEVSEEEEEKPRTPTPRKRLPNTEKQPQPRQHKDSTAVPKIRVEQEDDSEESGEEDDEEVSRDDEEEAESDEEEEESDEEEEEETTDGDHGPRKYEALVDFNAEQKGDLSFRTGEVLTVLAHSTDGWLTAQNSHGKKGLVPITYLKDLQAGKVATDEEGSEDDDAVTESEEESDDEQDSPRVKTPRSGRSGRMLWKNIKQAVNEEVVSEVLLAMGAVPAGFRESTLQKALFDQEHYTTRAYLAPKLSPSCLAFRDLFLDQQTNKIRARPCKIQRVVQIVQAKQIPAPGAGLEEKSPAGLEIKSRHVRVCLFDGQHMLSNIHTMRVSSVDKTQSTWNFNHKASDNMKSLEFGEFFIRSSSNASNIGILFELCMSYTRTSTGQSGEFSCGWMFQPLFDKDGRPTDNRQCDEMVSGGTPFEKGIEVDPSLGRKDEDKSKPQTSLFRSLVSNNKQPRLVIKLQQPTREQQDLLNTLPDVLISSTLYIQYLSFYRQILVDTLIKDNDDIQSTEPIHHPLLTTMPLIVDQPDLMDVLRWAWAEKFKSVKRSEKKDPQLMKEHFRRVFMENVYPLYHSAAVPSFKLADKQLEDKRYEEIHRLLRMNKEKKFMAACLLSADVTHKPFDIKELAFSVIGPHCVTHKLS